MENTVLAPTDFVALVNQTLEFAYPSVLVAGELSNFRVSKNRWVYFDLKDEHASVKCFGTVYQLPGPLDDGMLLQVRASPRLHQLYGFSLNVQSMQPVGEGSIKKAASLLQAKLEKEGLFALERKRQLPYPPTRIGLIASGESAAYVDFIKVLNHRWAGIEILHADVQVQGENAVGQLVAAFDTFNTHADNAVDVIVMTRGGGSADDLAVFSTEQVTRAVAASRAPTLVAIGHEVDMSLAELAADMRASTPSNAAELLVPDRKDEQQWLKRADKLLASALQGQLQSAKDTIKQYKLDQHRIMLDYLRSAQEDLTGQKRLLTAYNPTDALRRGYALVKRRGRVLASIRDLAVDDHVQISLKDGDASATITAVKSTGSKK